MDFKVKCVRYIHDGGQYFTVGKVYDVVNGVLTSDRGFKYESWSDPYWEGRGNNFESLQKWFDGHWEFELVEEKKVFTNKDLKTGMFGYFEGESDDWFVVVGDRLVYQKGLSDSVSCIKPNLVTGAGRRLMELYHANCFNAATQRRGKLIWKREDEKPLYNGKVVCTSLNGRNYGLYTVGKIYQFKDGQLTADNGKEYPKSSVNNNCTAKIHNFEDWGKWSTAKWIEIKE